MPDLRDTNEAIISRLDEALQRRGQNATLKRRVGATTAFVELTVRVRITGYGVDELVAGIKVTDSKFIMSPTQILDAGVAWPGNAGGGLWPKIGDKLVVDGRERNIEQCLPISTNGVVRIEGRVS